MSTAKPAYASSAALTLTLNSLSSSSTAGRESTEVSNATSRYEDVIVAVNATLATGTPANDKALYVYAWGSEDGTTRPDNVSGSDAAITLRSPTNLKLAQIIPCPDSGGLLYEGMPFPLVSVLGFMPQKWGIVVRNYTGVTLHSSGNSASYTGLNTELV